jgi:hypothetical protein
MSANIMFKNSPLIKAKTKDKREIYAFQFTGTDENISKIERIAQQLFEEFIISTHDKYCFHLSVEYVDWRSVAKINIGEWITFKNKEGRTVANIVTNETFKNDYEVVINKAFKLTDMDYEK